MDLKTYTAPTFQRIPTPWRQIAASPAVWAVAVAHFANNWGFYSMLTCLPTYMKKILHFDIAQVSTAL